MTMQSNFTWSKALGTGALVQATSGYSPDDSFNLNQMYGKQFYDRKFIYNTFIVYSPPFYKGQQGLLGRALGGWTFSTVFTTGSGQPLQVWTSGFSGQEFGGMDGYQLQQHRDRHPDGPCSDWSRLQQQHTGRFPEYIQGSNPSVQQLPQPDSGPGHQIYRLRHRLALLERRFQHPEERKNHRASGYGIPRRIQRTSSITISGSTHRSLGACSRSLVSALTGVLRRESPAATEPSRWVLAFASNQG